MLLLGSAVEHLILPMYVRSVLPSVSHVLGIVGVSWVVSNELLVNSGEMLKCLVMIH